MARIVNWGWDKADEMVSENVKVRYRKAANLIAEETRTRCPEGTVSRPIYTKGRDAGKPWTARDAGQLKRSVRVVERHEEKYGFRLHRWGNVRVYAGNYLAYYARIVEFYSPYMRPAFEATYNDVKHILENG